MDSSFTFHSPQYLWLLLAVPLFFIFDVRKNRFVKFPVSSFEIFAVRSVSLNSVFEFLPCLIRTVGLSLLIVALARPQTQNKYSEDLSEGVDIILTLDTSGSMRAQDMEVDGQTGDRLMAVKAVVNDFISRRSHDRIGMVIFGSEAYTQCPLTTDYDVLRNYLSMVEIGIAGEETAIGNAIATAVKRIKKSAAKSKIIILLTDGENTAGQVSPVRAAEHAKDAGIKIYTIAIGQQGTVPMPMQTPFGMRTVPMEVHVDTTLLKDIAKSTNGQFFEARDTETLAQIYNTIDSLEKTKVIVNDFVEYQEHFEPLVIAAAVLFIAAWFMQGTFFLRIC